MSNRLPSGVKVSRLKKDVRVSFAYKLAFLAPNKWLGFGDASIGITAGNGIAGAGDADLRIPDVVEPNDDLLLWLMVLGGFIANDSGFGVLGSDGLGEPMFDCDSVDKCERSGAMSGGAGDDILLAGKSILMWLAILDGPCSSVKCPSFVLKL